MVRPFGDAGGRGLDSGQTALGGELDQIADPLDAIFGSARVISEPGMRAHRHQKVRETFHQYAEIGLRAVFPQILQPHAVDAADVDAIKGAGDRVKPSRVDDDVEIVFGVAGLDAVRRDALDRRLVDVDEFDVGLIVNLVIPGFERHPAGAEAMVLRDQLFGDHGVFNALADLARDEVGGQLVGLAVGQHVTEIAHPDAETRLSVELLPESFPFLGGHFQGRARVGRVDVAARRGAAEREDLFVARLDVAHLCVGNLAIVQRRAPIGSALKHGQVADGLGDFLDGLHGGRAGANDPDALAREVDALLGPGVRVAGLPLEGAEAGDVRHRRRRKDPDSGQQKTRRIAPSILERDVPAPGFFLVVGRGDATVELDVAAQIELVGDVIEVAFCLGLGGKMLAPMTFLQQFLREGIAVSPTFGVEAGAGIAVPVPGTADAGTGLEYPHPQTELAQLVELIEPGNSGADDDGVEIGARFGSSFVRERLQCNHVNLLVRRRAGQIPAIIQAAAMANCPRVGPRPTALRGSTLRPPRRGDRVNGRPR